MNGTAQSTSPALKRSISPRPQTVGEEVKIFHDTSNRHVVSYKNWSMEDQQDSSGCASEQLHRPMTPAESNDCVENTSNPSPPPPFKWAQSLLCLLEDIQGVNLFKQFLEQEGQDTRSLNFWFACRGVKRADPSDREGLIKLINLIFEKKVRRISAISAETKDTIKQKLASNVGVDDTIFDAAQSEVEAYMTKTTYPNFLKSDIYIQHLGGWQNESLAEKESVVSPAAVDLLPTVHEDSELHISSNKTVLTKDNLWQRNKVSSNSKTSRAEGPAGLYLKSPYGNYSCYHSKYASFLPASAQDSELQSLSSDAQTDDTMSLTDSSVDCSMYSRSKQKRQQKAVKHNALLNKDRLSHSTFIPRTQRLPESMHQLQSPEEFHAKLVKKLNKVLEEQKVKDKISERFKIIEGNDCPKQEQNPVLNQRVFHKSNPAPVFDAAFFCGESDDNVQDILDQHVSRVFNDSGQHTPLSPPDCISPSTARPPNEGPDRSRVPLRGLGSYEPPPQDITYGAFLQNMNQGSQFTVPYSLRHRRDHDTHSYDSGATFDYASDDNFSASQRSQFSVGNTDPIDYSQGRRSREQLKRYASKKFSCMTDSSSSCVDSGISLACESVPPSCSKVTHWLETNRCSSDQEKEQVWKNSSTSPVLSRSSSSRKAVVYNSSRSGTLDGGTTNWPMVSQQELCMTAYPPPDTTSNLIEARRRLEDESRAKMKLKCVSSGRSYHDASKIKFSKACDLVEDGFSHRKQSRKSCPGAALEGVNISCNDVTVIGYSYGRHSVPYLSKLPGKNITLRQFKSLLSKKGNFRYFFKKASNDFGTGVVFEEVNDDYDILPLWEGKVFCVIESMDDNST